MNVSKKELTILGKEILWFGDDSHILPKTSLRVDDIKRIMIALTQINEGPPIDDKIRDEIKLATKNFTNNAKRLCSDCKNVALH